MNKSKAPSPIREADYEAIEEALMQSARGRWFLAEFSTRNRSADTRMLLDAISRLESTILKPQSEQTKDTRIRHDLIEMAEAIAQTRKEIAAMRPADQDDSQFSNATEELDAIVEATEKATSDILEAAEDIQETAWQMRENGVDGESCDKLDARATDIYTACSFQDLTGQRTSKVVKALTFLENRVRSMIDIWGLDDIEIKHTTLNEDRPDAHLLNGPARNGEGVDQSDVDQMLEAEFGQAPESDDSPMTAELADDPVMEPATAETPQPSAPVESSPALEQVPPGEVNAEAFFQPESLDLDGLEETKKQALFS